MEISQKKIRRAVVVVGSWRKKRICFGNLKLRKRKKQTEQFLNQIVKLNHKLFIIQGKETNERLSGALCAFQFFEF